MSVEKVDIEKINKMFEDSMQKPSRRSHTHEDLHDIKQELGINPISDFLLWLAKTDLYVLKLCTHGAKMTLMSLGGMVLFTSSLAFFSALYTIMTTVMTKGAAWELPVGFILAFVYAFGILIIDREIVASKGGLVQAFVRVLFAVLIATAVSYPVKLKFFEGAINTEIAQMAKDHHANELNALRNPDPKSRTNQRALLEKDINQLDEQIKVKWAQAKKQGEPEHGFCKDLCEVYQNEAKSLQGQRDTKFQALQLIDRNEPSEKDAARIKVIEGQVEVESQNRDLLTQWQAIDRIKRNKSSDYETISVFIFLFFMGLELVPLVLKYSLGKSEYNYYMMARDQLNAQKIISVTNLYLKAMQEDQVNAFKVPDEITDWFHHVMEDEASPPIKGHYPEPPPNPSGASSTDSADTPTTGRYERTQAQVDQSVAGVRDPDATIDESTPI